MGWNSNSHRIVNVTAEIPTFQPASFTRDNISDSVDTDPVGRIRHWRCIRSTRFDALLNTVSLSIPLPAASRFPSLAPSILIFPFYSPSTFAHTSFRGVLRPTLVVVFRIIYLFFRIIYVADFSSCKRFTKRMKQIFLYLERTIFFVLTMIRV